MCLATGDIEEVDMTSTVQFTPPRSPASIRFGTGLSAAAADRYLAEVMKIVKSQPAS
jgi:hypothetical protein